MKRIPGWHGKPVRPDGETLSWFLPAVGAIVVAMLLAGVGVLAAAGGPYVLGIGCVVLVAMLPMFVCGAIDSGG